MKTYSQFVSESVATDGGLYTFRKPSLHSIELLSEWMQENHIPNPVSAAELHVSVICSEIPVPGYIPDSNSVWVNPTTYSVGMLGEALVLKFRSEVLSQQWKEAQNLGAQSRWPTFQPHLSLSYAVPLDYDYSNIKPMFVQLVFMEEQCRQMIDGWASVNPLVSYTAETQ